MICLRSEWGGWKADVIGGLGSNPVGGLGEGPSCVFYFFYFSIWPLDLFAWLSLCDFLSSSPLPSLQNRRRSYFGDVEYFRGYSRAVVASVSVPTLVLAFYHAASFCSCKKKFFVSRNFLTFTVCSFSLPPSPFQFWLHINQVVSPYLWEPCIECIIPKSWTVPCLDGSQKDRRNVKVHTLPVLYLNIFTSSPPSISGPGCPCGLFAIGPLTPVKASKLQLFS